MCRPCCVQALAPFRVVALQAMLMYETWQKFLKENVPGNKKCMVGQRNNILAIIGNVCFLPGRDGLA